MSNTDWSSMMVAPGTLPPAQLTRMSMWPWAFTVSRASSSRRALSSTSQARPLMSPSGLRRPMVASTFSACAPMMMTLAPASSRPLDMLLPSTPEPPVTMAILPSSVFCISMWFFIVCRSERPWPSCRRPARGPACGRGTSIRRCSPCLRRPASCGRGRRAWACRGIPFRIS